MFGTAGIFDMAALSLAVRSGIGLPRGFLQCMRLRFALLLLLPLASRRLKRMHRIGLCTLYRPVGC